MRARVHQRLAADHPNVAEEFITDTCLGIAALAHEQQAIIEALFPEAQERRLAAERWRGEIAAIRQLGDRYYQEACQRGEPLPLAEQTVNLRLRREFFRLEEADAGEA
jgi:hypothetical protein